MPNTLVLVRHGQSEWNNLNLFTGWKDVALTEQGIAEARAAGVELKTKGFSFDVAYTSDLVRAQHTLDLIIEELDTPELPIIRDQALNERDYGDLTGLNKDDARARWGDEQVHIWRRSFDVPPPGGESLKGTAERVLPYFKEHILPKVLDAKSVLIAAHGNSLRALIMELDELGRDEVTKLNLATGAPIIYELDGVGKVISKTDLAD